MGRADGIMPFPGALALSEMQTALSRIWTLVTNSIFYYNNYYAKHASFYTWFGLMAYQPS